jgi:TRAP-type uncharacterized transport system substrate-binding protein
MAFKSGIKQKEVKMKKVKFGLVLVLAVIIVSAFALPDSAVAQKKMWRWGTADPTSFGYRIGGFMTGILQSGMPDYEITIYPHASTTANVKNFLVGNLESVYSAEPGLRSLYSFTKPFNDFEPNVKQMPVQSFWCYTIETHIMTLPKNKDQFRTWQDLDGKKIYMTKAGYMAHISIFKAMRDICGLNITHVEVDTTKMADALKSGTVDAVATRTTSRVTLPTADKMLDIATSLQAVNPTPAQIKKLSAAGVNVVEINIKKAFSKDVGVDKLYGVPFYFGYHHGLSFPEEDVYRVLQVFEKGVGDLAKLEPAFAPLAKDFAGYQVLAISSIPEVPVHPGLAKYLKEKGLWNSSWKIATEETIQEAVKAMKANAK